MMMVLLVMMMMVMMMMIINIYVIIDMYETTLHAYVYTHISIYSDVYDVYL